ncbi:MAG TPA: hypothetical protein VKU01_11700 [Bryobacteraceae bacterium]|nr:hypothetical protein [Bryobacteraceae bacterium]
MLGKQIEEGRGKRTGRRVIATSPSLKIESSVEEVARVLGVEGMALITYTSQIKPDGSLDGEGEAAFATPEGEIVTWKGVGVGRFGEGGSIHYCGSLSFTTTSQRFGELNGVSGVFQWEIDAQGNTHSQMWELTLAGATHGAAA